MIKDYVETPIRQSSSEFFPPEKVTIFTSKKRKH